MRLLMTRDISVTFHSSTAPAQFKRSVEFSRTVLHLLRLSSTSPAMFNAPRPAQPYGSGSTNLNGLGGSFVDENPLASSVYDDGLDPWSAAPSPSPPPAPAAQNANGQSLFKAVICTSLSPWPYPVASDLGGLRLTLRNVSPVFLMITVDEIVLVP